MAQPAAEEFVTQTPWANPNHPAHQQHYQQIQQQLSEAGRLGQAPVSVGSASYTTPAAQRRVVDLSANFGSASTIPENASAPGSSIAGTPYGIEQEGSANKQSSQQPQNSANLQPTPVAKAAARKVSAQQKEQSFDEAADREKQFAAFRSHSLSPSDVRKNAPSRNSTDKDPTATKKPKAPRASKPANVRRLSASAAPNTSSDRREEPSLPQSGSGGIESSPSGNDARLAPMMYGPGSSPSKPSGQAPTASSAADAESQLHRHHHHHRHRHHHHHHHHAPGSVGNGPG